MLAPVYMPFPPLPLGHYVFTTLIIILVVVGTPPDQMALMMMLGLVFYKIDSHFYETLRTLQAIRAELRAARKGKARPAAKED